MVSPDEGKYSVDCWLIIQRIWRVKMMDHGTGSEQGGSVPKIDLQKSVQE